MSLLVVIVPAEILEIVDETPTDRSYAYEDLLYLHSKSEQLPAASIRVVQGQAVVFRGAIFVRVARGLQKPIRAVLDEEGSDSSLHTFLERADVRKLDIREIESEYPVARVWHVFRFERALTEAETSLFVDQICSPFDSLGTAMEPISSLTFDEKNCRAEFLAITPLDAPRLYRDLLSRCTRFSDQHVRIVTYQGRRFESYRSPSLPG